MTVDVWIALAAVGCVPMMVEVRTLGGPGETVMGDEQAEFRPMLLAFK